MVDTEYPWILSLPTKISLSRTEGGALRIQAWETTWVVKDVGHRLEQGLVEGATSEELLALAGLSDRPRLSMILDQLDKAGLIHRSIDGSQGRLATWMPLAPGTVFQEHPPLEGKLSRFAFFRRKAGRSILESPLRSSRLVVYDWRAGALLSAYPDDPKLLSQPHSKAILTLAANSGLLDGDEDPPNWDFHSLLFHSRSRTGRSRGPHGMRPALDGADEPSQAKVPRDAPRQDGPSLIAMSGPRTALTTETAFFQVVEDRRSERQHGPVSIAGEELDEFLWRVAHEKQGRRPYPNAGKVYELEISLVVHRCSGLSAGLYRYQPRTHQLLRVDSDLSKELLQDAKKAYGGNEFPQVLVILSARFAKMNSRYRSIAYSNILKNVGVVMQTMALTANAMGLAACPLGAGDADLFCRAFETNYTTESSVGELILGSRGSSESD